MLRSFLARVVISALLLMGALSAAAQTYFNRRYALTTGTVNPFSGGASMLADGTGGYWIAGGLSSNLLTHPYSLFLQRVDALGNLIGAPHVWGEPTHHYFSVFGNALLPTPDGGFTLIGNAGGVTGQWSFLWRFSAQGDTLWSQRYRGVSPPSGAAASLLLRGGCRLADGGYMLVGEHYVANSQTDWIMLRTDSLGREQWRRTFNEDHFETTASVQPTPDGGFIIVGLTSPFSTGGPFYPDNGLLLKIDSTGREQWHTVFGGPYTDTGGLVRLTPDGGYVVAGSWSDRVLNRVFSQQKPTLFWFDSTGTLVRRRSYGSGSYDTGPGTFLALPDGGYLLAGGTTDTTNSQRLGDGFAEGFALRVCADGDSVWYRTYKHLTGGFSHNYLRDFKPTADGGYMGVGFLHPRFPDTGTQDVWAFKTDANGYLQAGGAPPTVVCTPVGLPTEVDATQLDVWPNPAPDGRFTLALPSKDVTERVAFVVIDAVGRQVLAGVLAGAETALDLRAHPAGVYGLRLTWSDGRTVVRRLVR